MPKDKSVHAPVRSASRLHMAVVNSPLVKFRHRKSEPDGSSPETSPPTQPGTPLNEEQVHIMMDNLRRHNKRYRKELDALEAAYEEKCRELWVRNQQLALYVKRCGVLEEVEQMNEALKEDDDHVFSEEPSPEHFGTQQHFPGDLALNHAHSLRSSATIPRDHRSLIPGRLLHPPEATSGHASLDPVVHSQTPNATRPQRYAAERKGSLNKSFDSLSNTLSTSSSQLVVPPPQDYALVPVNTLTKKQRRRQTLDSSKNMILHATHDDRREKSRIFRSRALFTVHNMTGLERIYVSIYDKRRVGVGKHFRISPVYEVGQEALKIEKPFARSTRSRFLLFCRNSDHFDESSLNMNPSLFRTIPNCSVEFNDEVYIYLDPAGGLRGFHRKKSKHGLEKSLLQKKQYGSLRGSAIHLHVDPSVRPAQVRKSLSLCAEEAKFLCDREVIARQALESFLCKPLEDGCVPRIAFCGSGGGCRAMVSTLGSLVASEKLGLLDCYTYVAGVSGSTWTIGLWESLGLDLEQLRDNIIKKFEAGQISRVTTKSTSELMRLVRSNWNHKQKKADLFSILDLYGAQLSTGLLNDTSPPGIKYQLENQVTRVEKGKFPLPIYTAVQKEVGATHTWFEFTPFEVGCTDYEAFVPSYAFGRAFGLDGSSQDDTPSPPFGTLLATFGSAFCAPLSRMAEEFFDKLEHGASMVLTSDEEEPSPVASPATLKRKDSKIKSALLDHKDQCNSVLQKMALSNYKIAAPARFNNFAFDPSKEASKQRKGVLELVDAGIECNLPFAPLLRPEREIDIIIACEASKSPNIDRGRALRSAAEYAQRKGLKFPPIDFDHTYDKPMTVFRDENDPSCPVIIYFPLKRNPEYKEGKFDPQENQRNGGYCSTFNFSMTKEQVHELSGLTQATFTQYEEMIKEVIWEVAQAKAARGTTATAPPPKSQAEKEADEEEQELLQEVVAHADELAVHIVCPDKEKEEENSSPLGTSRRKIVFDDGED